MTILITGGGGFVMSCLARRWLEKHGEGRAVVLDAAPADAELREFLAPVAERLTLVRGDVLDRDLLADLAAEHAFTEVVHGATVTSINRLASTEPDNLGLGGITRALEVNIVGTLNLLDMAARLPALRRFVYVSSGAVYATEGPEEDGAGMPEEGYLDPDGFYDASKYSCELLTAITARQFGLSAVSVRFSGVYGPMDRETPARDVKCPPYQLVHQALAGQPLGVTALEAGGDFIHSFDVADAMICLLEAPRPRHAVYNIAYGANTSLAEMTAILGEKLPDIRAVETTSEEADIALDPALKSGRWGAYDISRMTQEFDWRPQPMRQALHHYLDWVRQRQ